MNVIPIKTKCEKHNESLPCAVCNEDGFLTEDEMDWIRQNSIEVLYGAGK